MSSQVLSRGSKQQVIWRICAALVLALIASVYTTRTTHAAPQAQAVVPCIEPGLATIIDPVGGAVQVRMFRGATPVRVEDYPTSIQRIQLQDGSVIYGYCINSAQARFTNIDVCLLSEISNVRLAYLIAKYPPDVQNRINQAARQAAMWHFSNGINLDLADPTTEGPAVDAAVAALYTQLLDEALAIDPNNPTGVLAPGALGLAVDPVAAINQLPENPDHPITVRLTKGGSPIAGVAVRVASNFGIFDHTTATTDAAGEAQFVISSNITGTASITATAVVTLPKAYEYVVEDDPTGLQPFGVPGGITETVTALASKEWRAAPPPPPGRITLTKNVAGTADPWSFTFALDGVQETATNTAPVISWEDLLPGRTYTLLEVNPGSEWIVGDFACTLNGVPVGSAGPSGFEIPVTAGADILCSITNTRVPPGRITLTKNVLGTEENWTFTFRLDGAPLPNERTTTQVSPQVSWVELTPNQTYTLTEIDPGVGWQMGQFVCRVGEVAVGTIIAGGIRISVRPGDDVICSIDNTRIPPPPGTGAITVTKTVAGTTVPWIFGFTLNGANRRDATNESPTVVWTNLEPGTYVLDEIVPPNGWVQGVFACAVNGVPAADANGAQPGFSVIVNTSDSVACAIENTRLPDPGAISVTKLVTGTTDNWFFAFTLNGNRTQTVTNDSPTATWTGLQPGTSYTLAEVDPGNEWTNSGFTCAVNGVPVGDASPAAGFQVVVVAGQTVACTIANTRVPPPAPGSITLTKVVTQTDENDWSFAFQLSQLDGSNPQVRVVRKAAPTTSWNDLEPGVTYRLIEQTPGAPWVEGNFVCTRSGQPVGEAELNGPVTLTVNPGDNIVCLKYNVDLPFTNLELGEEPAAQGRNLFLPLVNR